jgi:hypothetical protein
MKRSIVLSVVVAAAMATRASAGGYLCWVESFQDDVSDEHVSDLRAQGPQGLEAALARFDELTAAAAEIDRVLAESAQVDPRNAKARQLATETLAVMRKMIDELASQRDATVSRLYWYTDLGEAKAAAAESGKPIVSLRMLGKLTDHYSCANSRFFRTALYSNKEISDYLRDHYVLHWQSVRPVPRVTIDFGDGRKIERTITGNSAHYVLDAEGRPLDVLPGLYGPQAFLAWLERSSDFAARLADVADEQRQTWLTSYHAERRGAVEESIRNDLAVVAPKLLKAGDEAFNEVTNIHESGKPTARAASYRAVAKSAAEAPLITSFTPAEATLLAQSNDLWRRIAAVHADEAKLDEASVALVRCENPSPAVTVTVENPDARAAGARAGAKGRIEDPILRLVRSFEEAMALDTVKNEYTLHRRVHEWFINGEAPAEIDALNERVYAELFLTPSSDPWLGLAPANVYTALTDGGLTADAKPPLGRELGAERQAAGN